MMAREPTANIIIETSKRMNFKNTARYEYLFPKIDIRSSLKFYGFLLLLSVVILSGCQPSEFGSADEMRSYIAEPANKLFHKTKKQGYNITVTYRPADLLIQQELGDFPTEYTRLSMLQKKYDGYYGFILSIEPVGVYPEHLAANGKPFNDVVQTLSQHMSDYVFLMTADQDTISVGEYMPSRTFGLSKGTDMLIVFNKEKSKNIESFKFNLNEFGLGIGPQEFIFRVKDLEQVPHLKFAVVS
jgi:hypothetical protein